MHFMDNTEERLDRHQEINAAMKRAILQDLQQLLHEHHALVRLFEYFGRMPNGDYKVVIRVGKRPPGTYECTFKAPIIDEVAILIIGENLGTRNIVITHRDTGQLQQISETHCSYDTGFLFHATRTHRVRPGARTTHNGFLPSFPFAREETQKSASIAVALRQPHVKLVLRYRSRNIHAVYHFCPYREKSFLRGGKRRNSRCVLTQRVEKSPLQYDTILR
ncbi:hypothetical protein EVAR_91974_1 [Eumeta japonica]|uniref:Uncharacterized protein n=1 Tax=Eumeta variegata TaxID=151549 RepID=A0A4C2A4C2_EUMVA|nr:hypothetical protein EVAR_91974_1 [Eumeta japonica]